MRYNNIPSEIFTTFENPFVFEIGAGDGIRQIESKYSDYFVCNYLGIDVIDKNKTELSIKKHNIMDFDVTHINANIVLAFEILEHIPLRDWEHVINKLKYCVSKKNGYVVITVPYKEDLAYYCKDKLKSREYFQIHNVHGITKDVLEYFFPNSHKKRLMRFGWRKRFWKGFSDIGIMVIWQSNL